MNDVGVEYGKALGGAAGLTIVLLFASAIVATVVWFAAGRFGRHVSPLRTMFFTFAAVALIAAIGLPRLANARASAVKHGKPVESVRILGVEILTVRAAPAIVQIAQSGGTSELSKSVHALKHPLFFGELGERVHAFLSDGLGASISRIPPSDPSIAVAS